MDAFEKVRAFGQAMLSGSGKETLPEWLEGEHLVRTGAFEKAEECFQKALKSLQTTNAPRPRQARMLLALANAQWKQKKFSEARESAQQAQDHLTVKKRPSSDLSACLDMLATFEDKDGNHDRAVTLLREALEVQRKVFPIQAVTLTQRYRRLAKQLEKQDPVESKALYKRAVEVAEKRLGTRVPVTADCLMELGRFQFVCGMKNEPEPSEDRDTGLASMELAVEIHREASGETSEELAKGMQFAAAACQEGGDFEKAVSYYERALVVRERQVGGSAADFAQLLMGMAETHTLLGNDAPAMELLQQAVSKLSNNGDDRLATALESLGEVYAGVNRFDEATSCYKKARVIWEKKPDVYQHALQANLILIERVQPQQVVRPADPNAGVFRMGGRSIPGGSGGRVKIFADPVPADAPRENFAPRPSTPFTGGPLAPPEAPPIPVSASMPEVVAQAPNAPMPVAETAFQPLPGSVPIELDAPLPASPDGGPIIAHVLRVQEGPSGDLAFAPAGYQAASPYQLAGQFQTGEPPVAPMVTYARIVDGAAAAPMTGPAGTPIPEGVGGNNLVVSFVGADGSPITRGPAAAPQDPVELTIVVPQEGMPRQAVLTPVMPADLDLSQPAEPREINGWEDLSFEYLAL